MENNAILKVEHLGKSFGTHEVLKDIHFEVRKGEVVSVIGASGSGKSTLLRCINMLEEPSSGSIYFEGKTISHKPKDKSRFRARVGMVFQSFNLFANMTVLKNCMLGVQIVNKGSKEEAEHLAKKYLKQVGMGAYINARPDQLSGGQKQRVALARTMVMKPRILLLDEPLSALDGVIKESIKEKIKEIAREFKLTTIIVTHDPEEALTLSDKVLIVNEGNIAQFGRPEEIIGQPADSFVKNFILNQLEVKRNNIFTLFSREMTRSSSQRISCTA